MIFAHDNMLRKSVDGSIYGGSDFNKEVFSRYQKISNDITIIGRCIDEDSEEELEKFSLLDRNHFKFVELPNLNNPYNLLRYYSLAYKKIEEAIIDTDFIIVRLPSTIGNIAFNIAKKNNKPCIVELVGCPLGSFWNEGSILGKAISLPFYILTKKYVKEATHVMYVTNKFLQNRYPNTNYNIGCSDVIVNPVTHDVLNQRIKRYNNLKMFNIGVVGSYDVNYKGHKTAIKAMRYLKKVGINNIKLHFVGPGCYKRWEELSKALNVEEMVIFHEVITTKEKMLEWYDYMDIYLQPSLTEGMPRAVIEAQSRACPVIGTDCGGIPDLIKKENLIRKRNYIQLANMIEKMSRDKNELIENSIYSQEVAKRFYKDILDEKRDKFYEDFLSLIKNDKF